MKQRPGNLLQNEAAKEKSPPEPPKHVVVYYDVRDGSYWMKLAGRYVALGVSDIKLHLCPLGIGNRALGNGLNETSWIFWNAQLTRQIEYAGPLAGHRVGHFQDTAKRSYLVTEEAGGVWEAKSGKAKPEWFAGFIQELLPGGQHEFFLAWLTQSLVALQAGDFRPGQVCVLAGPSQCGKSLLQTIITEILGGRAASPFRYLMEETQFNKDLAGAEHWKIEDPGSTTDIRTRRLFGSKLKEATVNRDFSIHQKGKDAMTLPLFRRVTISVNDEPENLAVIPPLDESMRDKLMLFKCAPAKVGNDRKKIWSTALNEVPAIRGWLLREWSKVPKALADDRFGIKAWHHPDLLDELSSLAPETRLLGVIDQVLFSDDAKDVAPVTVKSMELESQIRESKFGFAVERLLSYSGACGSLLGKLARSHPERISKRVKDGYAHWMIKSPPSETPTETE